MESLPHTPPVIGPLTPEGLAHAPEEVAQTSEAVAGNRPSLLNLIRKSDAANALGGLLASAAIGLGANASPAEASTLKESGSPAAMESNVSETTTPTPKTYSRSNAVWSYFGDPRAVYMPERQSTVVGWTTNGGSIKIGKFDKQGNQQVQTIDKITPPDDHNNPSLHVIEEGKNKGRIMAFYSQHAGRYLGRATSKMRMRMSSKPYSIKEWDAPRTIPTDTKGDLGYTYPNPVSVEGPGGKEEIQLYFRGDSWQPTYVKTRSDGKYWTKPRVLVEGTNDAGYRGRTLQRPYAKYASRGKTTYTAFTNAHPSSYPTSIYFAKQRDNKFYGADDTEIGTIKSLPLELDQADKVYDQASGQGRAWVQDVAADKEGDPVILYTRRKPLGGDTYQYATFKDGQWTDRKIVSNNAIFNDYYTPGATLDHEDPNMVYLSRLVDGKKQTEMWATADEGKSWSYDKISRSVKGDPNYYGNTRPVSPRGMTGDKSQVLWLSGYYKDFRGEYRTKLRYTNAPTGDLLRDADEIAGK